MNFQEFKELFEKKEVIAHSHDVSETPLVSICVQTYNQVEYISRCLDSLLMQKTSFPFEILLGDDSSSDGTRELCLKYAARFPDKIRLFLHHRENNIQISTKSTGLFNSIYNLFSAKGKYIAYCDGDDYWTDPEKLQKQTDFMEKTNRYVLTYHSARIVDGKGNIIEKDLVPNINIREDFSSLELKQALDQPIISTWCFRNEIRNIPVEMTKTVNADNFWMSLLGFYGEGKFLDNIKPSHYRIHSVGIWSLINKAEQLASKMRTYSNLSLFYAKKGEPELQDFFKIRSRNYNKMLIFYYLKNRNYKKGIFYFWFFLKTKLHRRRLTSGNF